MKIKMEIINSYDKLPLGMYLDICELYNDTAIEEDDRQMEVISILSGRSVDDLLKMPILEFKKLAAATSFLEQEEFPQGKMPKSFNLGGMTLIATTDITKMTTAQYVDFQNFSKMGKSKLVEQLSCFLIPKGMDYNEGYDVIEVQNVLRNNLTVTEAMTVFAFFLKKCRDSINDTLTYSASMAKRMKKEKRTELMTEISRLQTALQTVGDGWTMLSQWLRLPESRGRMYGA